MNDDDQRQAGHRSEEVDVVSTPQGPGSSRIWLLVLAAPTIWITHFMVVYLIAEAVCVAGDTDRQVLGLHVVSAVTVAATVVATVAIAAAGVLAYRRWRAEERHRRSPGDGSDQAAARGTDRALAFTGFVLAILSVYAVLIVGLPALWLFPC